MFSVRSLLSVPIRDAFANAPRANPREACARFLASAGRADGAVRASAGLARVLGAALAAAAIALVLDLAVAPSAGARTAFAVALAGAPALAALGIVAAVLLRRSSDRWLARRAEERFPALDGRLAAVASAGDRAPLAVDSVAPEVARLLAEMKAADVPDRSRSGAGSGERSRPPSSRPPSSRSTRPSRRIGSAARSRSRASPRGRARRSSSP
jgi:hypothetical protein